MSGDPILLEIVEGTLASVESEVETAIARTARSPMIRDAHDFRAGIHDRRLRKLTGRSYSALVQPVGHRECLTVVGDGDVTMTDSVCGGCHRFEIITAVCCGRVHVEIAAQVRAVHEAGQCPLGGCADFSPVLAQLGRHPLQPERLVNAFL